MSRSTYTHGPLPPPPLLLPSSPISRLGLAEGLKTADFKQHDKQNEETVKRMLDLAKAYNKAVQEEDEWLLHAPCSSPVLLLLWVSSSLV